jgi:hypothetical protein
MALTPAYPNPNQTLAAGGLEGATDEVITPAYWNRMAAMIYWLAGASGFVGCRAFISAVQSIANNTQVALALGGESFDSDPNGAMHDLATNNSRITIRTAGVYHVGAFVQYTANSVGSRQTVIRINGGSGIVLDTRQAPTVGGSGADIPLYCAYQFNAGDYIELTVYQSSGGALDVVSGILSAVKA